MVSASSSRRAHARLLALLAALALPGCERPGRASAPTTPTLVDSRPAPPATTSASAPSSRVEAPAPALRATTVLRSADLLADLDSLEKIHRALHPGLLRYNTPAQLDALFADARREFAHDRPLGEAFVELTRLTAALKCGHSYPSFFNQRDAIVDALFKGPRLPFSFRWIEGTMVVTRSSGEVPELVPGTVIEAVGGAPTSEILAALMPLARADGSNADKRRASLETQWTSPFEAFDILLPLVYPRLFAANGRVELAVRAPDARPRTITVALQGFAERAAAVAANGGSIGETDPLWKLEKITRGAQSIAYLRMPSWVAYKTKWDWKGFLHATMKQLVDDDAPALVIDLRGNEGGNDVGDEILAHVIDRKIRSRTTVRRVRFETVPVELRPLLDTWDRSFFELGKGATALADGWRELPVDDAGGDFIQPRSPRFRGKIVVLTDASNSSATFQFALTVQRDKLATLVGAVTGGNQRGINGGAFFFARLPRTNLEVDVPLIGTFPAGPGSTATSAPDAGVTPDIVAPITAADLAAGRDPQLEVALDVALGKRRAK